MAGSQSGFPQGDIDWRRNDVHLDRQVSLPAPHPGDGVVLERALRERGDGAILC